MNLWYLVGCCIPAENIVEAQNGFAARRKENIFFHWCPTELEESISTEF